MNNIPEGYKLVPVEPTEEMLVVMHDRILIGLNFKKHEANILNGKEWWAAVVDSAPTPPQPIYDDAKEQEAFEAVNPMPDQVTKFKGGYAPTGYSAWDAQDFCKKWDGWKQCAQSRAKAGEDE